MTKKTIVAFDDVALQLGNSGIARFWRELHNAIFEYGVFEELGIEPKFLSRTSYKTNFPEAQIDFPKYDFRFPAADRELISAYCIDQKVELFVSSYYTFSTACQNMMIVYDLIPEVFGFNRLNRGWMERELSFYASRSFFAISQNTKKDLNSYYPHTVNHHVGVGYPGIDLDVFKGPQSNVMKQKGKRYFVCVGSRYGEGGYKNGNLLVNALRNMDRDSIDFDLLFIGGEELTKDERELVSKGIVKIERLILNDKDLIETLVRAEALIYPSKYEGFGMPPLEALSVGTPVITTSNGSLPESVGELGISISSNSWEDLASAMLNTNFTDIRIHIKEKGPKRAKEFSWKQTAISFGESLKKTLELPEEESSINRRVILNEYTKIARNLQH